MLEALLGLFMPGVLESPEKLELFHLILRKCAHFTEFMILGVLSSVALKYMHVGYRSIIGLGYCVLIASLDETLQLFVSGRAGSVQDVLIDGSGALVGVLVVFICFKVIKCIEKRKKFWLAKPLWVKNIGYKSTK